MPTNVDPWNGGSHRNPRVAASGQLYRYVTDDGKPHSGMIRAPNHGHLWLTPNRYTSLAEAQQRLALPKPPSYRIGPVWSLDTVLDGIPLRACAPRFGQPGGGLEITSTRPIPFGEVSRIDN